MIQLKLQKQPTPVTCVHACLAMALGVPVAAVIDNYGSQPMNQLKLIAVLAECSFTFNQFLYGSPVATGWYFMGVPSLNIRGGMHQILAHYDTDLGCNGWTILDPSTLNTYAPDGSDLKSWCDLTLFIPGGTLPYFDKKYLETTI